MSKFLPESTIMLVLDELNKADEEVACTSQPLTYFNAIHPDIWSSEETIAVGDTRRPPTDNNFVYECISAGDTGALEPGWSTTQDGTFVDGTVTWKAHENYAVANKPLVGGDKSITPATPNGFDFKVQQIMGITTHRSGTLGHFALIEHATKKLHHVTTASTTIDGDDLVVAGRTTIFHELVVHVGIQ